METAELSEALHVVELGLSHCKWRLRPSTKRRLETDVMALCTGMRPVVMVDYGGKMPELQDYLCSLLSFCQKESPTFKHLRVLVIDDMIFLLHAKRLAEYVKWSLSPDAGLLFIDLEQDPPKMITQSGNSLVGEQLVSIWNLFAQHFPLEEPNKDPESYNKTDPEGSSSTTSANGDSQNSGIIVDLSSCMQDTKISIPTLNGWLLGYPVIYLFSTEHIEDAIYNLSTKYIRIFKVLVCRKVNPGKSSEQEEELMSFTVPYELSMGGSKEPWVEAFTGRVKAKWESSCRNAWKSVRMEVTECYPQAIVL